MLSSVTHNLVLTIIFEHWIFLTLKNETGSIEKIIGSVSSTEKRLKNPKTQRQAP